MAISLEKQELHDALTAAATGDEIAWRKIVDAFSHRVFALIKSKCGDDELSEEITQSTFCTVAVKLSDYTESGKFVSWLFQIAVNRLRDEMRRQKRHAVPMENETIGVLASGVHDPNLGELDETRSQVKRLRAAILQLSSQDQDIIHMRHSAGLSYKQIAEVLGEPLGTVLARQHRALAKLRTYMDVSGTDEIDSMEGQSTP
ncbi:MAG: sigma-70 family RNA polymerase sigma factor [Phycisphaerales bacterium]|jgi:RNA polymerase sigma-70 factor (ECF subfamily)|nr:sigma-70 family RNA polymerase sigma factor [Phycisphaerales bacterium]